MGPARGHGRIGRGFLALGAGVASVYVALHAPGLGDYPHDGGPAMNALLRGNLHAFASARPAMGELSLLLRLPFAALAYLGSPTQLSIYRWGAVPCVMSVGLFGVWLAGIAGARGSGPIAQIAIVAAALFNPLVHSALLLGHPEELLTASLAIAAVVCAAQRRAVAATVLLGLAVASKQWAVVAAFPVLAVLAGRRLRVTAGAAAIVAAITLPAFVIAPAAVLRNQFELLHEHYLVPPADTWLYLISPHVRLALAGGADFSGPRLSASTVGLLHPLIITLAAAVALVLARRAGASSTVDQLFAAVALIFVLRCALDTETMPYFQTPLLLALLAWDALRGERLPYRGLLAVAVSYGLFTRMAPAIVGAAPSTAAYDVVTVAAAFALARTLLRSGRPASARLALLSRPGPASLRGYR